MVSFHSWRACTTAAAAPAGLSRSRSRCARALVRAGLGVLAAACASTRPSGIYELRGVNERGLPARVRVEGDTTMGWGHDERMYGGTLFLRGNGSYELVECSEYGTWSPAQGWVTRRGVPSFLKGPFERRGDTLRLGSQRLHGKGMTWLDATLRGDTILLRRYESPVTLRFVRTGPWVHPWARSELEPCERYLAPRDRR